MAQCKNCGGKLEENAKFCVNCGTKVELQIPQPVEQPAQPAVEEKPVEEAKPDIPIVAATATQQAAAQTEATTQTAPAPATTTTPPETMKLPEPQTVDVSQLNNPANYPNGAVAPATQTDEIIVPTNADIDVSRSIKEERRNEAMPDIEAAPPLEEPQTSPAPNTHKIARPTQSASAKKRNRKTYNGKQMIQIVALVIGSLLALVIIGFIVAFGLNYLKSMPQNNVPKLNLNSQNSHRVGSKEYGYVSVPNSWTAFGLSPENQTIQYTDGTGWIVTLYSVDQSVITAKSWANNIVAQMNSVGAEDIGMEETEINDYAGYKLFGYYSNVTTYLAAWVLNGNDGKVHYIAIEGPERYNDFYDIVYTFDPTK